MYHFKKISTWRERIGQTAEFPLYLATDVERAMVAEIAELRAAQVADTTTSGRAAPTLGEVFASVGGFMTGGELGYPSFGSMDALRIFTQRSIRAALAAAPQPQVQSESRIANLEAALRYYADGNHFVLADPDAWDTVSGEPVNFQCDEAGTATVEDGSIAKMVLAGEPMPQDDEEVPATLPKSEGADQQPVTPSVALADNNSWVAR
ncbi:MAG: hypothetical protein M3Y65_20690 [Pseudomonadota bacterium]|nr:hypothetical protein [Pseudomonadota bacterium]